MTYAANSEFLGAGAPLRPAGSDTAWGAYAPSGVIKLLLSATMHLPRNWAGKRLFYGLRKAGRTLLGNRPVDVVRFGARMRLNAIANNVCEGRILFNPDYFDLRERNFLAQSLPESPVFIDAGANIGGYSFFVCAVRPKARVIAIDADDGTYRKLSFNAALNPQAKIETMNCALSDKTGTVTFFVNDKNHGESSIRDLNGRTHTVEVKAKSLLRVAEECALTRIDALKIDIEGAEDVVLKAFFERAPERLFPKLILIEHSPRRWDFDIIPVLEARGYAKVRRFGGNIVLQRD